MSEKISIIFQLDSALNVYRITELVKSIPSGDYTHPATLTCIELIDSIESDDNALNLAEKLSTKFTLWQETFPLHLVTEMGLCVGQKAGFTDSRMVSMWMRTWQHFVSAQASIWFSTQSTDFLIQAAFQDSLSEEYTTQLADIRHNSSSDLHYTRAPRIG